MSVDSFYEFSLEVSLYVYKSIIRSFMECFYHTWDGAPRYYLDVVTLDRHKKRPVLVFMRTTTFEVAPWNSSISSFFFFSQEFHLIFDIMQDFSATIPRYYKYVNINSFVPHTSDSGLPCLQNVFLWLDIRTGFNLSLKTTFFPFYHLQ